MYNLGDAVGSCKENLNYTVYPKGLLGVTSPDDEDITTCDFRNTAYVPNALLGQDAKLSGGDAHAYPQCSLDATAVEPQLVCVECDDGTTKGARNCKDSSACDASAWRCGPNYTCALQTTTANGDNVYTCPTVAATPGSQALNGLCAGLETTNTGCEGVCAFPAAYCGIGAAACVDDAARAPRESGCRADRRRDARRRRARSRR